MDLDLLCGDPDRFQNILVMMDLFTHFALVGPSKDQIAQKAVHALWAEVILVFGCPARLHSDRGAS